MSTVAAGSPGAYQGNDKLLFGLIMGVIAFWLFAQTTLNVAPGECQEFCVQGGFRDSCPAAAGQESLGFIAPSPE